ncbi:MAG: serine hydrolase domain-containing protein [Verrucomicrobiota bacterium]
MNLRRLCLTAVLSVTSLGTLCAQLTFVDGELVLPLQDPNEPEFNPDLDTEDMAQVRTLAPGEAYPVIPAITLERYGEYLAGLFQDYGLPGLAFAVVQGDGNAYQATLGFADLRAGTRISDQTLFNIGPATQGLTSLLAATLDGEQFSYDKPAKRLWPRFKMSDPAVSDEVTIRHLLSMTAGIPDYTDNILDPAWARPEDVLAVIWQAPVVASPGDRFSTSQVSSAAGGYLLTKAARQTGDFHEDFLAIMQERVFDPIGMQDTTFSLSEAEEGDQLATPHSFEKRGRYDPANSWEPEPNALAPAIGAKSSLRDMTRWLITELNQGVTPGGKRIAAPVSVRERWQPARTEDSRNYGMGWTRRYYRGAEIIGTTGSYDRHSVALAIFPAYRTAFVAMVNADSQDAQKLLNEIPLGVAEMLQSVEKKAISEP